MSTQLLPDVLKAFLAFYRECDYTFAAYQQWKWIKKGGGWNAQTLVGSVKRSTLTPVHFTIFGMVDAAVVSILAGETVRQLTKSQRDGIIVLKRPEWTKTRIVHHRIALEYDKQLLTLAQAAAHHGWDPALGWQTFTLTNQLLLASDKDAPRGALLLATVLLDIRQQDRGLSGSVPYILSVVQFEAMYK
ncbi:hypothetical protein R3P38DRAFT_2804129 [Favolaschia claudopus]|uniref:Uncharacterized protein n=1 Tax=Favolaschia claudopus TaxID=2862362 RepID=A0AAV9ZQN5_9AGAR